MAEFILFLVVTVLALSLVGLWRVIRWVLHLAEGGKASPAILPLTHDEAHELRIAAAQMGRLLQHGLIDFGTYTKIMGAIEVAKKGQIAQCAPVPVVPLTEKPLAPLADRPVPPLPAMAAQIKQPTPMRPVPLRTVAVPQVPEPSAVPSIAPKPVTPVPVVRVQEPPKPPRKSLAELLAGFMEESNIRWGELIGGLLIVGCSIALVFTFWNQIEARPWFKFFLFTATTAAVFLAGLYTEHRWKLPTTSRGTLLIASLLVPLNFLAIAAFSQGTAAGNIARIAGELVATGLFTWLVWLAGRVLVPRWPILLAIGVLGPSAMQGIIHRLVGPQASPVMQLLLASLPLAIYCGSLLWAMWTLREKKELGLADAHPLLRLLGMTTFAVAVPLGLLGYRIGDWHGLVQHLALPLSLGGIPALAIGLLMWRRMNDPKVEGLRTAGISIGIAGILVLLGGLPMAWPNQIQVLLSALACFAVLTAIAMLFEIRPAHIPALLCLVLAYIVGWNLVWPQPLSQLPVERSIALAKSLFAPHVGSELVGLSALLAGGMFLLRRLGRREDGWFYGIAAIAVSAASLALVTQTAFATPIDGGATWVYSIYALAALATGWFLNKAALSRAGAALAAVAIIQGMVYRFPLPGDLLQRWTLALLTHASLFGLAAAVCKPIGEKLSDLLRRPWSELALCTSAFATITLASGGFPDLKTGPMGPLSARILWIAGIWLVLSIVEVWPTLFNVFQAALTAAVAVAIAALLQHQAWFAASPHPLADGRTWQTLGVALAILSLAWIALRLSTRSLAGAWQALLRPPWLTVDRCVNVLLLAALVLMSILAAVPGIHAEFAIVSTDPLAAVSSTHLHGISVWALLAGVVLVLLAGQWERFNPWTIFGTLLALACASPLLAASFETQSATASALRWSSAAFLLLLSPPICWPQLAARPAAFLGWPGFDGRPSTLHNDARVLVLLLTIPFILILTLIPAVAMLNGQHLAGPAASSFFARIGNSVSFLIPLLTLFGVLIGYALRQRSPAFAFCACLVLNLTVTLGYLLSLVTAGAAIDTAIHIRTIELNAIAMAAFALAWTAFPPSSLRRFVASSLPSGQTLTSAPNPLRLILIALPAIAMICLVALAESSIITNPARPSIYAEAGGSLGWVAWTVTFAAAAGALWQSGSALSIHALGAAIVILGSMAAITLSRIGNASWLGYHALLAFRAAGAWAILGIGFAANLRLPSIKDDEDDSGILAHRLGWTDITAPVAIWSAILGAATLALSLLCMHADPARPTWTLAGLFSVSLLSIGLAFWTGRNTWIWPAGLLLNIAASVWWIIAGHSSFRFIEMVEINILILATAGIGSLLLELSMFRPMRTGNSSRGLPAYHHFAAIASLLLTLAVAAVTFLSGGSIIPNWWLLAITLAGSVGIMLACLWDIDARYPLRALYLLGLAIMAVAAVFGHATFGWSFRTVAWNAPVALAGYSILIAYLYTLRRNLALAAEGLGIPMRKSWPAEHPGWLAGVTLFKAVFVTIVALAACQELREPLTRLALATGVIATAVAMGLLAKDEAKPTLHTLSLLVGLAGAVLCGWAILGPHAHMLDRGVIVMLVSAAAAVAYAVGLVKFVAPDNPWAIAGRRLVPLVGGLVLASLLFILGMEGALATDDGTPLAWWGIISVLIALATLMVGGIVCAIMPGRDPLELSERGRTGYVYAAEVCLALIFVHLRFNFPELFNQGLWRHYWPFIIMLIAFTGVGLGEFFRRSGRMVLAEPLGNTGAFLPLLPVLAYWLTTRSLAWQGQFNYAGILFLAGGAYAALSIMRKSYGFGLFAALMANGGLWAILARIDGLGFMQHPQLWLIPGALCVLAASHLNRQRLSAETLQAIRYACMLVIYASSTAEIWMNGVRDNPGLPLVLALLSVAGVMAGILLRIQSFLFLGTSFLAISIAAMIRYATLQADSNWPWMVAGIVLGAAIVALFALFEKKREDMLSLVEGLKQWEK